MKKLYKRLKPLLGTFVEIAILADQSELQKQLVKSLDQTNSENLGSNQSDFQELSDQSNEAISLAFSKIEFLQKLWSFQNKESEISKINFSRCEVVEVDPETIKILRLAKEMEIKSGGLFNCTVGGKLVRSGDLPDHGFRNFLDSGLESDILLTDKSVQLKKPVLLTLDGIAKGYAVDLAVEVLKDSGFFSGWINAGGDLKVFGEAELPVAKRVTDDSIKTLGTFSRISIASSKVNTQRNPDYPGTIVSSALNQPQPGVWTIAADQAWLADALTKVAALLPKEKRQQTIEQLGGRLLI